MRRNKPDGHIQQSRDSARNLAFRRDCNRRIEEVYPRSISCSLEGVLPSVFLQTNSRPVCSDDRLHRLDRALFAQDRPLGFGVAEEHCPLKHLSYGRLHVSDSADSRRQALFQQRDQGQLQGLCRCRVYRRFLHIQALG